MRSKSLAGHQVGLARLSAKLIAFWNLFCGLGLALAFPFFPYFNGNKAQPIAAHTCSFRAFRYADIRCVP